MIEPIQRLPRYELIYRDLLKKTKENHPDYKNIETAYKKC